MARTFHQLHKKINATYLFDLLRHLFSQNYVVGALTFFRGVKNEAVAHAYSVLGIYEITTDDGNNVKLVRYFNPWHLDVWTSNPWGDDSHNWTNHTKSQVPYLQGNDGIVFSSIEDYYANFAVTNWAEIHDNYDVSFIDIANNFDDFNFHVFEVNFTYNGDADKDFYIFNDQSDGRLLLGCSAPVSISGFTVTNQRGTVYNEDSLGLVKIINPQVGLYKAKFSIKRNQKYVKSLTMTAYSQEGKLNFIPPPNNVIIDKKKKLCANNCNLKGRCNTVHGTCVCYFGVI